MTTVELPIFPLRTAPFPDGLLALRIFERRYLDMIGRAARDGAPFVVCAITAGGEVGPAEFHRLGTAVRIVDFGRTADGLLAVTAQGERRARVTRARVADDGLHVGDIELLAPEPAAPLAADDRPCAELLARLLESAGPPYAAAPRRLDDAGWVAGRLAEFLPLDPALRQQLLEMDEPARRLDALRPLLRALQPG